MWGKGSGPTLSLSHDHIDGRIELPESYAFRPQFGPIDRPRWVIDRQPFNIDPQHGGRAEG
jgi:hypothetical protein